MSENKFKLNTTRMGKEGTYAHVLKQELKDASEITRSKEPGSNQKDEVWFEIDETSKVKVTLKNAYKIGIAEHKGTEKQTQNVKNKKTGLVEEKEITRHLYDSKAVAYIQGTDGNLYLIVDNGTKVRARLTDAWADLSAYIRNLITPVEILDITKPQKAIFKCSSKLTKFTPVQAKKKGGSLVAEVAEEQLEGYKLKLIEIIEPKAKKVVSEDTRQEIEMSEDEF